MSDTYFSVYLGQNGAHVTANMTSKSLTTVHELLGAGRPFRVVMSQGEKGTRQTSLVVAPRAGGVTLHVGPAMRIPIRQDGQPATQQHEVARWLEPYEQPAAEVQALAWAPEARSAAVGPQEVQVAG